MMESNSQTYYTFNDTHIATPLFELELPQLLLFAFPFELTLQALLALEELTERMLK